MVELRCPIRFGDTTLGPVAHSATIFDMLAAALEELATAVDYSFTDIIENGGIPYAPVNVRGGMVRYPLHGETVVVTPSVVELGDRSFTAEYVFTRAGNGEEYGRSRITHVTIDSDGNAETILDSVRERLVSLRSDVPSEVTPIPPSARSISPDSATFSREFTIRTPHLEAADLGYFEDYFRFIAIALEEYLEKRGRPLSSITECTVPFQPFAWRFEFDAITNFERTVTVHGTVDEIDRDATTINYVLEDESSPNVHGTFEYACSTASGERDPIPEGILDVFRTDSSDR